ncbi:ABL019Wp [Eremothecium gossypii ATCC 10895]|uniref:ABL019Wp n=1 Tax=Eremothecium gossypii (strain ATCC 10895 / CBS 109.51 / FGSC 9923 / NRRL Y-1056) TaxID=284811 RepID=Q75DN6_EREGS|nr:ABL019Wp [Eremothecium gossypii ATCC 10895]AAS50752.2 ABL019Wp [Eremothecium gossypii ATCC 10895]AEY95041.1 FABL019Wp [Eremothecium gossypii FDAG1]
MRSHRTGTHLLNTLKALHRRNFGDQVQAPRKDGRHIHTVRKPTPPTAVPLYEIIRNLPNLFPLPTSQSWEDYKAFKSDREAFQVGLLSTLPFFERAREGKIGKIIRTPVDDEGNYINEFCIRPASMEENHGAATNHLIFIHGYGAGLGFFIKNFEHLPLLDDQWVIHAIDLPGYGYSTRCQFPFDVNTHSVREVEAWFHERLETWLSKRGLLQAPHRNMVMAHSMGAYLTAHYAQSRQNHFKKLIMCSPAGISPSKSMKKQPPWWFIKLWDRNVSPFSLVRNSGPLGSKLTSGWSFRRFRHLLNEGEIGMRQFEALHKYSYAIFNMPGSGEYLLSFVLKCGGDPRIPLLGSMFSPEKEHGFKAQCEWLWLYGDHDWMDKEGGQRASSYITDRIGGKSRVEIVPNSGHHLYFDNYSYFNKILLREMQSMMQT